MLWDLLAVFAVVLGFLLIIGGLDTLIEWRAWFLGISGLVLLLPGIIRICMRIRHLRTHSRSVEEKN